MTAAPSGPVGSERWHTWAGSGPGVPAAACGAAAGQGGGTQDQDAVAAHTRRDRRGVRPVVAVTSAAPRTRGASRKMTRAQRFRARLRCDHGSLALFTVVLALALFITAGIVVDFGIKLQGAQTARGLAEEAARAGAGQVNLSAAYSRGQFVTDPAAAVTAAERFLSQSGHTGRVIVTGNHVQVTVTVSKPAVFARFVGITQLTETQSATAILVEGVTGPGH